MRRSADSKSARRRRATVAAAFVLAIVLGVPGRGQAAWTEPRGTFLTIPSYFHYVANRQLDPRGHGSERPSYVKDELRLYSTYGLTDSVTLGLDGAARRVRDDFPGAAPERAHWSETAIFARFRVRSWAESVVSVQPLVRVPGSERGGSDLGRDTDKTETELRLLYGQNYRLAGRGGFAVAEAGYRRRFGPAADQVRADATLGLRVTGRLLVLAQSFNTISVRRPGASAAPDYNLYKAQVSVVRELRQGLAVQVGAFREYAGRNTGAGQAGFVALWIRF